MNWWQQIRFDLKTIVSIGWHHSLIPDEYLIRAYFKTESDDLEALEANISEAESELADAVENAQVVAAYEPDEDEKVTAAVIKKTLKLLIDDLKGSTGDSATTERKHLEDQETSIKAIEKRISDSKIALKSKLGDLELKLQLKRLGSEQLNAENQELIQQVDLQIATLDPKDKSDQRKINALNKDKLALQARLAKTDNILAAIGGQVTEEESRRLILTKLYDLASHELNRYLNAERRGLIQVMEKFWDKYAISSFKLESDRTKTMTVLAGFLSKLGYLK
ncbi:MAG: hypothetical protein IPK52_22100 [Chloroflexi bacterium]|nr:hypothetical protein [Chloroflexota bacterium]